MGRFDNIVIVSDVDGTFIAKGGSVPKRNLDAISYFTNEGGIFTFATGRDHRALLVPVPMAKDITNAPVIASNGGYLYDFLSKTVNDPVYLPVKRVREAVEFVYEYDTELGIRYSSLDGSKYCRRSEMERSYADAPVIEREEWNFENCFKVVVRGKREALDALRILLENQFGDELDFVKSSDVLLEMVPRNVNKGVAIGQLRKFYADKGKNVKIYACGDNENDIEMLLAADVAVCPSNAIEAVRNISKHVLCTSGEGIIADLVENIL